MLYRQNVRKLTEKHIFKPLNQEQHFHWSLNHKCSFSSGNAFLETYFLQLHHTSGKGSDIKKVLSFNTCKDTA